jgi:predicted nucleic acid-binding protein
MDCALIQGFPPGVPLRAGDAIHLASALDVGEPEIWTNDRHLLKAATHFGLAGRSV